MDRTLLIGELQALVTETRRKYPEVKDAAERALTILRPAGPSSSHGVTRDGPQSDDLLSPILLGCKTKVAKILVISIGALQRLVSSNEVPLRNVPVVLSLLDSVIAQGVDVQLRVLQVVLSILTHCSELHGDVLGDALLLCFKLQDSRTPVVASTAAATLRQAVMLVFDRVQRPRDIPTSDPSSSARLIDTQITIIDGSIVVLHPDAVDAYNILLDLCLLTSGSSDQTLSSGGLSGYFGQTGSAKGKEKAEPKLLRLETISRTLGLELIESILSGHEDGVKQRPELLAIIRLALCPFLLSILSSKSTFPITLRATRLVYLLLRSFCARLQTECEVFLLALVRLAAGEIFVQDGNKAEAKSRVTAEISLWLRVLAMEILRGVCTNGDLLVIIFLQYDGRQGGTPVLSSLCSMLSHVVAENPTLLGVSRQMQGIGVASVTFDGTKERDAGAYHAGLTAMATAASAGVNAVGSMMVADATPGLNIDSSLRVPCIDQHDKAEAPHIPETYVYLLACQAVNGISNALGEVFLDQRITGEDATQRTQELLRLSGIIWPPLTAAYTFLLETNLSNDLFGESLQAVQLFITGCASLGCSTSRDVLINMLARFAMPPGLVMAVQSFIDAPTTPRTYGLIAADSLGLPSIPHVSSPIPSERNLAVFSAIVDVAVSLLASDSVSESSWRDLLELLQTGQYVLSATKANTVKRSHGSSSGLGHPPTPSSPAKGRAISGTSVDGPRGPTSALEAALDEGLYCIDSFFSASAGTSDKALINLLGALLELGAGAVRRASTGVSEQVGSPVNPAGKHASALPTARRRPSGLNGFQVERAGETNFAVARLGQVCQANLDRLSSGSQSIWERIVTHLARLARSAGNHDTRLQAAETLENLIRASSMLQVETESGIPCETFDVLARLAAPQPLSDVVGTDYEVRLLAVQTLCSILESCGHALRHNWGRVLDILHTACNSPYDGEGESVAASTLHHLRTNPSARGQANLIRAAFPALNLVCTDFLTAFAKNDLEQLVDTLGRFGTQRYDNNVTLSAIGLMWVVSDGLQVLEDESRSVIWRDLLSRLSSISCDPRPDARSAALQTLFRCLESQGSTRLRSKDIIPVLSDTLFPMLDKLRALLDEASEPLDGSTSRYPLPIHPFADSVSLAMRSIGAVLASSHGLRDDRAVEFVGLAHRFLRAVADIFSSGAAPAQLAALETVKSMVLELQSSQTRSTADISAALWEFIEMVDAACSRHAMSGALTQDVLSAYIAVAGIILRSTDAAVPEQTHCIFRMAKFAVTYQQSPTYRPDVDDMTPVQAAGLALLEDMATSSSLLSMDIIQQLADYIGLAFGAAFDFVDKSMPVAPGRPPVTRSVTYVALAKRAMPMAARILREWEGGTTSYGYDAVIQLIRAMTKPVALGSSCPAANRFGTDIALPLTASIALKSVLEDAIELSKNAALEPDEERRDRGAYWTSVIEALPPLIALDQESGTAARNQGDLLRLITKLMTTIPLNITQATGSFRAVGNLLRHTSMVYHLDREEEEDGSSGHIETRDYGTLAPVLPLGQRILRFGCLSLLFAACTESSLPVTSTDDLIAYNKSQRHLQTSAVLLPHVLDRCETSMRTFLLDLALRGDMPFEAIRAEELVFLLWHLRRLRVSAQVWSRASSPDDPDIAAPSKTPSKTRMHPHLSHLYDLLVRLASHPGRLPQARICTSDASDSAAGELVFEEHDARLLARDCLLSLHAGSDP